MTAAMNVQGSVLANGNAFIGAGYNAMLTRVLGSNGALDPALTIRPGAELVSATGNLTLGTTSSTYVSDWNLATFRFGAWDSVLLAQNTSLPVNAQSWTLRLTAGADTTAADYAQLRSLASLATDSGSILLGKNGGNGIFITPGSTGGTTAATTANAIANSKAYQVIRTGSGDIEIAAGRDVQLRNQFASIFTVGTQVLTPGTLPTWWVDFSNFFEGVGALGGGDVTLQAGHDVANVDAVIPTNARMSKGTPDAANLVELGGGDLAILAGRDTIAGVPTNIWIVGSVNLSDASPSAVPGAATPLGYLSTIPLGTSAVTTGATFYNRLNTLFAENGALTNALDTKQSLHAPGLLHRFSLRDKQTDGEPAARFELAT